MQNFRKLFVFGTATALKQRGRGCSNLSQFQLGYQQVQAQLLWSVESKSPNSLVTFGPAREWKLHEENQTRGGNTKNNRIKFSSASTWPNATWHRQHQLATALPTSLLTAAAARCFWPCSMCDRVLISCCIKGLFLFSLSAACGHATCIVRPNLDASSSSPSLSSSHCLLPGQNAKTYFIIAAGYRAAASMYNLLQKAELIILIGQPREKWGKVYAPTPAHHIRLSVLRVNELHVRVSHR